ncbi:E3 ubiquitin-protein ligase TRIM39-like isoform X2 [Scyliorhinus torazame]|uniref:E3 ubiquitin-protein ligase TRIM39-like isoform X2 n=1 Tax=Scyliorhinus torazame TaxID=75743 RepID=UPI003B59154F
MASEKELENLINEAICSICLEFYNEPVMIDCGHNFCKNCILNYWDKHNESISCPKCREEFSHRNIRLNRFAANMVESVRKLSAKPREASALRCEQHDEKLKLFCENDKVAICVVCAVSHEHKDHKISPLKDAAEVYKGKLQIALDTLNKQVDTISSSQVNQKANITRLKDIKLILDGVETSQIKTTEINFNLSLYEPIGPLQYIVWKRMLRVINPVPALLSLDPQTAHPRLLLTDNDTQVKRGEWKKVPEFPERFNFLLSVLAVQGFNTGRHYWEIDVGNNSAWDVGAAKASVARKAIPESGIWAVGLWDKEYTVFSNPRTILKLESVVLRRLGVYLDYEEGQVSFYNAISMAHIYTFTEKFTEAVYPYFSTESRTDPLKLVALQL